MRHRRRECMLPVPRLLVSVRDATEAEDALLGGADIVDVKEPSRGSLGAADRAEVERVLRLVDGRIPVSVAAGELLDLAAVDALVPHGARFVKLGLAGCSGDDRWCAKLKQVRVGLPEPTELVPVAYADWSAAHAPQPQEVLHCAKESSCHTLLVDTFSKSCGQLFDCWSFTEVADFVESAHRIGMQVALAGGLRNASLFQAVETGADILGVRGAVCDTVRTGRLRIERVKFVRGIVSGDTSSPVEQFRDVAAQVHSFIEIGGFCGRGLRPR